MRKETRILLILLISMTFMSLYLLLKLIENFYLEFTITRYKLVKSKDHQLNDTKVILFWNNFFSFNFWGMPNETNSEVFLESIKCPETNCILTHDKNFLSEPQLYDALVYHIWESWNEIKIPVKRSANQYYILAFLE